MGKLIIPNCTVEIEMPIVDVEMIIRPNYNGKVQLLATEYTHNLVVRCADGRVITFLKVLLKITGKLMPAITDDCKQVILFTVDNPLGTITCADTPIEVNNGTQQPDYQVPV